MSASLVGSEMCIRDSHSPFPGPLHCSALRSPSCGRSRPVLLHRPRRERCLLYTSDAADDM
eukprot:402855-Alexandrium_andersonii.AAC.1